MVDEIIVATDSDEIDHVVAERNYAKTRVYRRSAENACDTASTESHLAANTDCTFYGSTAAVCKWQVRLHADLCAKQAILLECRWYINELRLSPSPTPSGV